MRLNTYLCKRCAEDSLGLGIVHLSISLGPWTAARCHPGKIDVLQLLNALLVHRAVLAILHLLIVFALSVYPFPELRVGVVFLWDEAIAKFVLVCLEFLEFLKPFAFVRLIVQTIYAGAWSVWFHFAIFIVFFFIGIARVSWNVLMIIGVVIIIDIILIAIIFRSCNCINGRNFNLLSNDCSFCNNFTFLTNAVGTTAGHRDCSTNKRSLFQGRWINDACSRRIHIILPDPSGNNVLFLKIQIK
mmetsp:Transcript_25748/g.39921  ORF Transcript_25748/g.39921 Transcript_25748/m.39921 type:complete len:244 (-) Transcript_25748:157-888(-)